MRVAFFWWTALLTLSSCGGRVHNRPDSGSASDSGTDAGRRAKPPCKFKGYAPALTFTPAHGPLQLTAIDTTGTGTLDLAMAERANGSPEFRCELFANPGNGRFVSQPSFGVDGKSCQNLVAADFNQDGKVDLATQPNAGIDGDAGANTLGISFGTGAHEFAPALAQYPMPNENSDVVAGDFDGDGRADIAAAGFDYVEEFGHGLPAPEPENFTFVVLLNAGAGQLAAPVASPSPHWLSQLATGDFDGDGRLDIAAINGTGFDVYFNAGAGAFEAPRTIVASETWSTYGLGVADFNGDGKADMASSTILDANLPNQQTVLQVFSGRSDRGFDGPLNYVIPNIPSVYRVVTGEFNGDDRQDIAMVIGSDPYGGRIDPIPVAVFLNQGDGTFASATNYFVGDAAMGYATSLAVGDFNGDAVTDIAVTTESEQPPYGAALNVLLSECQ